MYLFNLSNLETNNLYDDIEQKFLEIIENIIIKIFNENIFNDNNKENDDVEIIKKFKDKIINYFGNYFFAKKIMNKSKQKIYLNISLILKKLIFEYIANKINKNNNNIEIIININTNIKLEQKYILELKKYLKKEMEIEQKIYEINSIENYFEIISDIDKWIEKEIQNFKNIDKKIIKELDKNNICSNYNILQKYLLSYSVKNNWENIKKIRAIENYYKKINNRKKENKTINNYKSNAFSFNNYLNNENNNNDSKDGINELKGSHIFY